MTAPPLSKAVSRPKHIPASLVYDFDMNFDPEYNIDPHQRILDLLETAPPVFWTPRNGGHWIALSYQANFNAARDAEAFSSEIVPFSKIRLFLWLQKLLGLLGLGGGHLPLPYPIMLDPPRHAKYRQPLQGVFSPRTVKQLEQRVRDSARELIDDIADRGECEFMATIAEPLPVALFLRLFGLPVERLEEYRALFKAHMNAGREKGDTAKRLLTLRQIAAIMRDTFLERRDNPKDDIISLLWSTEIDGRAMTLDVMENYGVLMFIAGLDTVMQSMGYAFRHLALDQPLQATLRENPALIGEAIEEILRRYTFALPPRRVTRDMDFEGAPLKKDEMIVLFLHGANLDSQRFQNPEQVDIHRDNKVHIAFNAGPHRCLGSHLARMELRVIYEEFLSRIPSFSLNADRPPTFKCNNVVGIESLHLTWHH